MKFSHTLKTSAEPEKIWAIWTDVEHWAEWDTELSAASLDSAFGLGAVGKLTPKIGQIATFKISQFTPGESYTFTVQLPLCKLNVYRYLRNQPDGLYFTHEVSFQGLLAVVFRVLLGRQFQTVLPTVMENIKQIAETKSK
jgi:Polyketide cyclase / dehydrase and lipid transport